MASVVGLLCWDWDCGCDAISGMVGSIVGFCNRIEGNPKDEGQDSQDGHGKDSVEDVFRI